MGLGYNSEDSDKWWEFLLGSKWPHQGFTLGYDLIEPDEEDEMKYYGFNLYLGPFTLMFNWGKHSWNDE